MKNKADIPDMLAILTLFLWREKKKKSKLNRESEAYWSKGLMILSSRFLPCLDSERSSPHSNPLHQPSAGFLSAVLLLEIS